MRFDAGALRRDVTCIYHSHFDAMLIFIKHNELMMFKLNSTFRLLHSMRMFQKKGETVKAQAKQRMAFRCPYKRLVG